MNDYDPIKDINSSTFVWKCRVKLQALWKGINHQSKEFFGLNMLFNTRIHAYVSKQYYDDLLEKCVEGHIYILSNFKVKDLLGDEIFRPVRNNKHIYFKPHTKLEKDEDEGLDIEDYAFDLYHMKEIEKWADDNRFLIDFVEKLENLQPKITINKNNQDTTRVKFEMCDGRVNVTLFDQLGINVKKALKNLDPNEIFVIISSARVGRYEGSPNISNYPTTRFYINPNHYSITELKVAMKNKEKMDTTMTEDDNKHKIMTVKEIRKLKSEFKEEQEEYNFPEILRFFVNQKYKMTIELNENNLKNGSTVYEAREMVENNEVSNSFDQNKEVTTYREDIPVIEDTEEEGNNIKTPATGNSTNMKLRMRKNVEPLTYDNIVQQPVIPLKNIKKEKVTAIAFKVT
ncbi:hypothetical protein POM88_010772 [Heracleum sosnowskyi]|uniref:DUF223 domain-containing protein n=1 Tax=Heracleum sosnowskyi TaxID=360622 RepID=A0AAD8IU96_9APIA|nr:hypothetical protein POM88_010772 [Heracleum sosnowskyi]